MSLVCRLLFPLEYLNETFSAMRTVKDLKVLKTGNCSLAKQLVSAGDV